MATYVQTAAQLFSGGTKLTCFTNSMALDLTADPVEMTTYCSSGAREHRQGMKSWQLQASGYADYAASTAETTAIPTGEEVVPANLGAIRALTVCPLSGTEGTAAYVAGGFMSSMVPIGGAVGEMAPYSFTAVPTARQFGHRMARGLLEANRTVTTSSNTTGSNTLGAVSATQYICANLHVFTLTSGASLTVIVESDDNSGFTTPTTRLSFTAASTRSGEYKEAAGAITDTYWRAKWTISGSTPSVAFACAIGIR